MDARLILIPGMGVDARLFEPQRPVFPRLEVPAWIPPQQSEPLASYARRLAATIPVDDGEPFYLGGASFGGMLALEMAHRLRPRAVFLIASARSGRAVAPHARWTERLCRFVPDFLVRAANPLLPLMFADIRRLDAERRARFAAMVHDVPLSFQRWASRAIFAWELSAMPPCPVHHIHGADDTLIPLRNVQPDRVVPDVGHLLNTRRPDEVNRFLLEHMRA